MGKGVDWDKLKEKVITNMKKGKGGAGVAGNELRKAVGKIQEEDFGKLGDIMKEAILIDPDAFKERAYILFDKMLRATKPALLKSYEKFFIENYCKFPDEEFEVIADGWILTGKTAIMGQIFVSKYRIIATGVEEAKSANVSGGGIFAFLNLIKLGTYAYNKAIMDQIAKALASEPGELVSYGVLYPIKGCYEVQRQPKKKFKFACLYKIDVPYKDKKGKDKIADMDVQVEILKTDPELEAKLIKIEEILKANAKE
ncbi:MAG: hypothetical protein ACFFCS_21160 [Candidatus Hodarchaeota archaeon]